MFIIFWLIIHYSLQKGPLFTNHYTPSRPSTIMTIQAILYTNNFAAKRDSSRIYRSLPNATTAVYL